MCEISSQIGVYNLGGLWGFKISLLRTWHIKHIIDVISTGVTVQDTLHSNSKVFFLVYRSHTDKLNRVNKRVLCILQQSGVSFLSFKKSIIPDRNSNHVCTCMIIIFGILKIKIQCNLNRNRPPYRDQQVVVLLHRWSLYAASKTWTVYLKGDM